MAGQCKLALKDKYMLLKVEYRKHTYACLEKIDVPLTTARRRASACV